MIWELDWGPLAGRDVHHIPWQAAARLCAAVTRFAETNRGPAERVSPLDPRRLQVVVPGAVAYILLDFDAGVLRVQRMFPRALPVPAPWSTPGRRRW